MMGGQSMLQLPLPADELKILLSKPIAQRGGGWDLSVTDVSLAGVNHVDQPQLVMVVECHGSDPVERWRVAVPLDREDLDPLVRLQSFVLVVRANLEEWWDTKSQDAWTRSWGTRLADQ